MYKKILFIIGFLFLLMPISAHAQSVEQISRFVSNIIINTDASINVKETIFYHFDNPRHGIYRYLPYRYYDKTVNKYYQTPISDINITDENGQPYQYSISQDSTNETIKIGDPNKTIDGDHSYIISYKVANVINYFDDHDELYWNVTGDGWDVPINNVNVDVILPQNTVSSSIITQCYTGSTGSTEQNCTKDSANNIASFSASVGPLTVVTGWNKGVIDVVSRSYDKSYRHESGWYVILLPLTFILMMILYFKKGRDPFGRGTIAPEFSPPNKLLPAEIGTLIDEKAGNDDITSTIIDLAVRGYLKIREKDKKYTLVKLKDPDNSLRDYEKGIIEGIFAGKKEVALEEIYLTFEDAKKETKQLLYKDLIDKKYFPNNPESIRGKYLLIALLIIFLCGGFFWLSIILVITLFFCGLSVLIFAKFMSKKTKEGVIAKEKSLGFKEFLYRAERYKIQWEEKEGIFEKYLPYAMVFGIADKWAKNFKDIYKDAPSWYEGDFRTFNTIYFVSSLNSFSSTANHSYSPPASSGSSGFGGGMSGGGFGGGGGGSW